MMSSNDIATYGAFIMEGLMDNSNDWQRCHEGQGCLETVMAATSILDYAIPLIEKAVALNLDFPGVLDYEVMSEYGTWWRDRTLALREFPSKEACEAEMLDLICEFFGQGVAGGSAEIRSLLGIGG